MEYFQNLMNFKGTLVLKTYNHCHKSLAHTRPVFPIQCWKAQFVRTPCELALLGFVNNAERVGAGGRLK